MCRTSLSTWSDLDKQSININIFGRQFPARVNREEAAVIQSAARLINDKMRAYKAEYRTQDDVDIAIMCCLEITTEYLSNKDRQSTATSEVSNELNALENKIDRVIQLAEES